MGLVAGWEIGIRFLLFAHSFFRDFHSPLFFIFFFFLLFLLFFILLVKDLFSNIIILSTDLQSCLVKLIIFLL